MKVITYNVNGIRAALNKGLLDFMKMYDPDIICFQELKAMPDQIPTEEFQKLGYHCYWFSAQKKGYSGTAILSKSKPKEVICGFGNPFFDAEGRTVLAHFDNFSVLSAYFPSGSSGDNRQSAKMEFLSAFYAYTKNLLLSTPNLMICGDYNICHKPIDIHDPVSNKNSSGFLPEEREWMDRFFELGFVDTFRELNKEPHHYSWWSYRAGARARNKGWRIDYNAVSEPLKKHISSAIHLEQHNQSDHCALLTEFTF